MERNVDELLDGLEGCVDLIEAWIKGPIFRAGIVWNSDDDHPPALQAARRLLKAHRREGN